MNKFIVFSIMLLGDTQRQAQTKYTTNKMFTTTQIRRYLIDLVICCISLSSSEIAQATRYFNDKGTLLRFSASYMQ